MRLLPGKLLAVLALAAVSTATGLAGCGGGDENPTTGIASDVRTSVAGFKSGFADATGVRLNRSDLPGGAVLLSAGRDGDGTDVTNQESAFLRDYGNARIYVVEDGDPDLIFSTATGRSGTSTPVESGGDTVSISTDVKEPDDEGVVWSRNCVNYEKQEKLDTCAWTGTKRYGDNVIVTWTQTTEGLTPQSRRLDDAVTAAVSGSGG
jgi:hypothetical protein